MNPLLWLASLARSFLRLADGDHAFRRHPSPTGGPVLRADACDACGAVRLLARHPEGHLVAAYRTPGGDHATRCPPCVRHVPLDNFGPVLGPFDLE